MDLKEKLKEILKKNYGITSDAELLEELNNMESVDLGIFVTQIDTGMKWTDAHYRALSPKS